MTTETEAAIEFTYKHLSRVLPGAMQGSKVEIEIRLEILCTGLLEPVFPEACDGMQVRLLVERAQNGDVASDERLRVLAMMLIEEGTPLPFALREYVSGILRRALPPRKHKLANRQRDMHICIAVQRLADQGFRPTRNVASRGGKAESACSIVRAATERMGIHLSEDAIEKIWQKSDGLLGAFKSSITPETTRPGTLDAWRNREREELISILIKSQGDAILADLGRFRDDNGRWSEDDIAALHAECERRVKTD